MKKVFIYLYPIILSMMMVGCSRCAGRSEADTQSIKKEITNYSSIIDKGDYFFDFEKQSKKAYKLQEVNFDENGIWSIQKCLIGNSEKDLGISKSLRMKNLGEFVSTFTMSAKSKCKIICLVNNYGNNLYGFLHIESSSGNPSVNNAYWETLKQNLKVDTFSSGVIQHTYEFDSFPESYIRFWNHTISGEGTINIDNIVFKNFEFHINNKPNISFDTLPIQEKPSEYGLSNIDLLVFPGNVSNAKRDKNSMDNYLITKRTYDLSYNNKEGIPNWVSWHLTSSDIGSVHRGQFEYSTYLPFTSKLVTDLDYRGTGFDRGHICPSGDRTADAIDNQETFQFDNVCPQIHDLNAGPWEKFEHYCREVAKNGKELYIISGPFGRGGENKFGEKLSINKNGISVPAYFWKVVIMIKRGENDLERIQKNTTAFAVLMPNISGIAKNNFREYITSIDEIEKKTGYDFFSILNNKIENEIESKVPDLKVLDFEMKGKE